jgi:hypothetical protein
VAAIVDRHQFVEEQAVNEAFDRVLREDRIERRKIDREGDAQIARRTRGAARFRTRRRRNTGEEQQCDGDRASQR